MTVGSRRGTTAAPMVPRISVSGGGRSLSIDEATIDGGLLGDWQRLNRGVSIPSNMRHLETDGVLRNLEIAAGAQDGAFVGPVFMDAAVYKTLEAVVWETHLHPEADLSAWLRRTTALLARAQWDDGYINSFVSVTDPESRYRNLAHSHEVFILGFLLNAGIAARRTDVSGADELWDVALRAADHLVDTFLDGRQEIDGHPGVEMALVEFYRLTGREKYLRLAEQLVRARGRHTIEPNGKSRYFQDHLPVTEAPTLVGHAVRALFLDAGVVDVAIETGDQALLAASIKRWEDLVATKTYLTGGMGSRHGEEALGDAYELPSDRSYSESCAAFGAILWSWRLLLATGEARFAELIERVLFNVFAASTAHDGHHFFYVNPLQRRPDHFESDDPGRRHEWFECPCCPPNITRMVSTLAQYVFTVDTDTVYIHQYATSTLRTVVGEDDLALHITTDYPWDGRIEVTVEEAPERPIRIALRVPSWSAGMTATVNGTVSTLEPGDRGYAYVEHAWRPGDTVVVDIPMAPRLTHPDPRIDAVRGTVAIERGPLVYCLEQTDQPTGVDLQLVAIDPAADLRFERQIIDGIGDTTVIEAPARRIDPPAHRDLPYGPEREIPVGAKSTVLRAIPYFQWDNRGIGAMRVWTPIA